MHCGRLLTLTFLSLALLAPSWASAAAPGSDDNADKRPSLSGQTKTKARTDLTTLNEKSILESIDNQKMVLELEDRNAPSYPMNVIALADFYWDLAEAYGHQALSEDIEAPLHAARESKNAKEIKRLEGVQAGLNAKKADYQQKTIQTYKRVIRDFPRAPKLDEIRYFLAYNLTEMGQPDEGVQVYTDLIGQHPNSPFVPDALVNVGEYYFEASDFPNALKLYQQAETNYSEAPIAGYAVYKQGWCYYNMSDFDLSLSKFIAVIKIAEEKALEGKTGAIALKREAQNDMVLPYSKVGKAAKAISFFKTYAPGRYLALSSRLADVYTEQTEYRRSTKLLRALVAEARKGDIAGEDKSYMVVRFQRQIVSNAMKPGDKKATVAEISELIRLLGDVSRSAPADFIRNEKAEIKEQILTVASGYHKEYNETLDKDTLEYTQRLYDEYLRVFRQDENAYQISMNNALLMLATEKYDEAAAEFEKVIAMDPAGEFADNAAERAVIAYLKSVQLQNKVKEEATDDLSREELASESQRFVNAIDRWMGIIASKGVNPQTKENIPKARFAAATIFYNANQFAEAAKRFSTFVENHADLASGANPADRRLACDGAMLLLSSYNLPNDVDNLSREANGMPDRHPRLISSCPELSDVIAEIKNSLNFKRCFKDQDKNHLKAAECFDQYAKDFATSTNAAAAVYNSAISYFKAKKVERAIKTQLEFYKNYRSHELAPKALYSLGEMFQQTLVYDQAATIYENFVKNHKAHPLAEKALRFASIYRKTLGQYKAAIANLELYLRRYGDSPSAPRVHLDIINIMEKQNRPSKVIRAVTGHLKSFPDEAPGIRLQALNTRGKAHQAKNDLKKSMAAFEATLEYFRTLNSAQLADLGMPGISAVAESHFHLGETLLRRARRIKLNTTTQKGIQKALKQKLDLMNQTKDIYEKVIAYGHPGWMIAGSAQLGLAFEDLADAVENAPIPRNIKHLAEVVDQYQQDMAERAKVIRGRALVSYRQALEVAKRERWFNEYSEKAEAAIARLDLTDLSIKEFRLRPENMTPNGGHPGFLGDADSGPFAEALSLARDPKQLASRADEAERLFKACVADNKSNADGWYDLGLMLSRKGDMAGAEGAWRKAVLAKPDHGAALAQLAGIEISRGQVAAATSKLQALIDKNRFQAEARNILAATALATDDYETAIKHARNTLLGDRNNIDAYLNAAIAYYRQGLYDQAGLIAKSYLDDNGSTAAMHNVMGMVYLTRDDSRRATDAFTKALEADPTNTDARLNLATLELSTGAFESSLQRIDQVLLVRPQDHKLINTRAVALRGLKQYQRAESDYERVLSLKPSFSEAEYNLCVLHHQYTNKWAEAKRTCGSYLGKIDVKHPKYREVKKRLKAAEATLLIMEKTRKSPAPSPTPAPSP